MYEVAIPIFFYDAVSVCCECNVAVAFPAFGHIDGVDTRQMDSDNIPF